MFVNFVQFQHLYSLILLFIVSVKSLSWWLIALHVLQFWIVSFCFFKTSLKLPEI